MDLSWPKSVLILLGEFLDDEAVQERLDVLAVGHVPGGAENGVITNGVKTLDVLESGERTVRCWRGYEGWWGERRLDYEPRLSAAIIMPSLYLIARTLVPVTMGCLCTSKVSQGISGGWVWTDWVRWTPSAKVSLTLLGLW